MRVRKGLRELWRYREFLRNMVARDLKTRYKSSILGIAWSWVNPLLMMAVYSVVFTILAGGSGLPNYPIFVLCALLPWNFFATSVSRATESIVGAASLVRKVYFPREILPVSIAVSNLVNFLVALPLLFLLALVMGNRITLWALLLPVPVLVQLLFTIGVGLFTAALNVFYRDTRHIMDVLLLAWFFLTPIFYPIAAVPEQHMLWGARVSPRAWVQRLNPMATVVASCRDLLYWGRAPDWGLLLQTAVVSLLVLAAGYVIFLRYSPRFAEDV